MRMPSLKTRVEQSVKVCRECRYKVTAIVTDKPNGDNRNNSQPHLLTVSDDAISIAAAVEKAHESS